VFLNAYTPATWSSSTTVSSDVNDRCKPDRTTTAWSESPSLGDRFGATLAGAVEPFAIPAIAATAVAMMMALTATLFMSLYSCSSEFVSIGPRSHMGCRRSSVMYRDVNP
jgi:hypothetical protein